MEGQNFNEGTYRNESGSNRVQNKKTKSNTEAKEQDNPKQ